MFGYPDESLIIYVSHAVKFFVFIYTSDSTINIMSAYHRIVMSFSNMSSSFVEDIKNMLFYTFFSKPQNWKRTFLNKIFYQVLQLLFILLIVFKRWYVISRPCFNDCSPDGFPPEKITTTKIKSINLSYGYIT